MGHQLLDTKHKYCRTCGEPTAGTNCQSCQAQVKGEAAHRKQYIEKEAETGARRR